MKLKASKLFLSEKIDTTQMVCIKNYYLIIERDNILNKITEGLMNFISDKVFLNLPSNNLFQRILGLIIMIIPFLILAILEYSFWVFTHKRILIFKFDKKYKIERYRDSFSPPISQPDRFLVEFEYDGMINKITLSEEKIKKHFVTDTELRKLKLEKLR